MANATGGLIVVGINDPADGVPLSASHAMLAVDEPARRRLRSQLLARAYPTVPIDVFGYQSAGGQESMLIVRVGESDIAPHEYTEERGRFPVRRGTQIDGLALRELEALLYRRQDTEPGGPAETMGQIRFDAASPQPDFIAIRLSPERPRSRVLRRAQQLEIEEMVRTLPGLNKGDVTAETLPDGVLFRHDVPIEGLDPDRETRTRRCYVGSSGDVELRLPIDERNNLLYQVLRVMASGYALSSWTLRALGLGPVVSATLAFRYNDRSIHHGRFPLPTGGTLPISHIDFTRMSFEETFIDPVLYLMRWGGAAENDDEMRPALLNVWREYAARAAFGDWL
ncbi:MAG: hypothetical protein JWM87_1369 [Candidatus Eremiobacteraeota bacterium]|nr:hypothetical protein [Candidatus Eremiobacteraeota bacterium]